MVGCMACQSWRVLFQLLFIVASYFFTTSCSSLRCSILLFFWSMWILSAVASGFFFIWHVLGTSIGGAPGLRHTGQLARRTLGSSFCPCRSYGFWSNRAIMVLSRFCGAGLIPWRSPHKSACGQPILVMGRRSRDGAGLVKIYMVLDGRLLDAVALAGSSFPTHPCCCTPSPCTSLLCLHHGAPPPTGMSASVFPRTAPGGGPRLSRCSSQCLVCVLALSASCALL